MILKDQLEVLEAEADSDVTRTSVAISRQQRGMLLTVKTANEAGTVSFTPSLQMKTLIGDWVTIWTAAAAIVANGQYHYVFYPGTAVAGYTEYVDTVLPFTWRVVLTYAGTPGTDTIDTEVVADLLH